MTTRIRLRRDTAANWAAANPVLELGEPGVETDTRKTKYGDGVTPWNGLSYASGGADASYSNATPQALGTAAAGTANTAARGDHVHAMPTAAQVGAEPSGTAAAAVAAHVAAADPHPAYTTAAEAAAAAPVQSVALTVPSGWSGSSSSSSGNVTLSLGLPVGSSLVSSGDRTNWEAAYSERLRWDGGATGLNATTARASLGLASVAASGAYGDLSGRPSLGTAAATDATAYATAAQGAKADTAVQPATLSGYVQTSDSRLSDAREWSAATVTQADAEAGTATTRVAWTVQRVWQAVAAWWAASAMSTKLAGIASGATANQTDAYLLNRANHTGTQAADTITGLATVATSGAYSDLSGRPTLGTAAVLNVGTSAGNVVQLDGSGKLPAVNGSNLTGLPSSGGVNGYVAGNWVIPHQGTVVQGSAITANTIYLISFTLAKTLSINGLAGRVALTASGNIQFAVYASSSSRLPTGLPLASTGNLSSAASGLVSSSVSTFTLSAGEIYWGAINASAAPTLQALSSAGIPVLSNYVGASTLSALCTSSTAVATTVVINGQTFGSWPDVTSLTKVISTSPQHAVVYLQVASIP